LLAAVVAEVVPIFMVAVVAVVLVNLFMTLILFYPQEQQL
jgi:hypothetical protein